MLEDLQQLQLLESAQLGAEIDGSPSPETGDAAELMKQQAEKLRREMEELKLQFQQESQRAAQAEREREMAERRRVETERWGNEANMRAKRAEEIAQQAAQYVQQQQRPPLTPPQPLQDLDTTLSDPRRFQEFIQQQANFSAAVAHQEATNYFQQEMARLRQELGQSLQSLQSGIQNLAGPVVGMGAQRAEAEARSMLEAKGVDPKRFDAALPAVRQALTQAAASSGQAVTSDPQAYILSYLHHDFFSPAPAERQEPPMNLRSDVSPQTQTGAKKTLSQHELVAIGKMAEHLSPEIAKRVAAARREGRV